MNTQTQAQASITPLPWKVSICQQSGSIWIEYRDGMRKEAVCKLGPSLREGAEEANAAYIVKAANMFPELVAELRKATHALSELAPHLCSYHVSLLESARSLLSRAQA